MPLPQSNLREVKVPGLVRERAYSMIRDAILTGKLKPGERLEDAELQTWLGMSRTPIRQALLALTSEGFVETAPQSHTRVAKARAEDASGYLQAVGVLVTGMTLLADPVMTPGQRTELVAHLIGGLAAIDRGIDRASLPR
ncbi:GntR family transcriptional regulator [Leifsonia sp. L25]|uniref:GntR family transcriptional regulator n=1 Tax=Leifsonia sp. L25 TaxID=3423957 RepID=UPI003D687AED